MMKLLNRLAMKLDWQIVDRATNCYAALAFSFLPMPLMSMSKNVSFCPTFRIVRMKMAAYAVSRPRFIICDSIRSET